MAAVAEDLNQVVEEEKSPLGIKYLVAFLSWIEEIITALSGYGLTFALALGVVDLLTDGLFSSSNTWVTSAYAWAMALGIGGQLVGSANRSSKAFHRGQIIAGVAFFVLMLILGFAEYQATTIFSFHKAFGITVDQSLARLGIDQAGFIQLRTGVAVGLVMMSGFLRFQPARGKTIAQIQADADRKIALGAINAKVRTAQIATARELAQSIRGTTEAASPN